MSFTPANSDKRHKPKPKRLVNVDCEGNYIYSYTLRDDSLKFKDIPNDKFNYTPQRNVSDVGLCGETYTPCSQHVVNMGLYTAKPSTKV